MIRNFVNTFNYNKSNNEKNIILGIIIMTYLSGLFEVLVEDFFL